MINDYKYIFVIFPPGAGGNHLANLLARSPKIANRNFKSNGNTLLYEYYKTQLEHMTHDVTEYPTHDDDNIVSIQNLSNILNYSEKLKHVKDTVVFCSHVFEFGQFAGNRVHSNFLLSKTGYILFSYPNTESLIYKRHRFGKWYLGEDYDILSTVVLTNSGDEHNVRDLYSKELFSPAWNWPTKPYIDERDIYQFDPNKFFTEHGFDYLTNFLDKHFGITLDDQAKEMHELYLKTQL